MTSYILYIQLSLDTSSLLISNGWSARQHKVKALRQHSHFITASFRALITVRFATARCKNYQLWLSDFYSGQCIRHVVLSEVGWVEWVMIVRPTMIDTSIIVIVSVQQHGIFTSVWALNNDCENSNTLPVSFSLLVFTNWPLLLKVACVC